jgi:hypothetical protein
MNGKPYDCGDAGHVGAAQDEARMRRDMDLADLRKLLDLPEGRRFLRRLLAATGPLASGFAGDASATAFKQGVRWAGLWVFKEMTEADAIAAATVFAEYAVTDGVMNV